MLNMFTSWIVTLRYLYGKQLDRYMIVGSSIDSTLYRVGKLSDRLVRAAALRLAQELCELLQRPVVATVTKVLQR